MSISCALYDQFFVLFWKRSTEPKNQPNSHWQIRQQNTQSIFYPVHSKGEGKIWPVVSTLVLSCYFDLHMQCLFSVCYLLDNYYCPLLLSLLASCYSCSFFIITIIDIIYYLSSSFNNHFGLLTEDILCRYIYRRVRDQLLKRGASGRDSKAYV